MNAYFAGIDLGTSGIKAGIIDYSGRILSQVYWDTELKSSGPGKMEQDPEDFYDYTLKIIHEAVDQAGVASGDIAGLAIDGQMGGIIGIDRDFSSVTGLDMGLDIRSESYNALLHREYRDDLTRITCGSPRNTPKMMMWSRQHPEIYKKIDKFVTLNGYVTGKLVGLKSEDAFIDYTLLSFFGNENVHTLDWSPELTEAYGLDTRKLPRVVDPWNIVGYLTREAATNSGLKAGLPVMAGAGDQPAGFLGAGFLEAGQLLDVSGSTTLLCCSVDTCIPDTGKHAVMYMPSIIKGKYTAFSYINGGGITLKWFRDELASGVSWDDLTRKAAKVPPGSEGLLFVPYFGGRQCPYNAELRGSWIGLNWGHRKEHMFRSLLEGLSYDYALGLENITGLFPSVQIDTIEGTGGGSANTFWNQMKADIMNKRYKQLYDYQFPLRGCGLIVGYSLGIYTNLEKSALKINKNNESITFNPNPQHTNLYASYYGVFKKTLISPMDSTMHDLFQASLE